MYGPFVVDQWPGDIEWLLTSQTHIEMKSNWSHIPICSALLFVVIPYYNVSAQSDRIIFREPLSAVHDSIAAMNRLMDKVVDAKEKNYFFDKQGFLFINNKKIGQIPKGGRIDFLGLMVVLTDLSQRECKKFLTSSMFLKRNFLAACIRHERYGVYFYLYQSTGANDKGDFRYIVLYDERLINMTGTDEAESFTVLDRQQNLLLLMPAEKKK